MVRNRWVVAVDVGGTFTDAVASSDTGEVSVAKVPSTPADPTLGLIDAVHELAGRGVALDRVGLVCYGTTIATNAVLTGGIARVALLSTEGFRDILSYRDGTRPHLYDLELPRPRELVRRRDRIEVRERISGQGQVLVPLEAAEIERAVREVARRRPDAIAVALLFSYLDDSHERALRDALVARLPGIPVSISSEVAREFREYPRTATTALNAGLRPIVGTYLTRSHSSLSDLGIPGALHVMQSNGGVVPAQRADREAHRLILSGPAAGVIGAISLGASNGLDRLISLDMGGTSLDVCLVRDGVPPITPVQMVQDQPILGPAVDIVAVGAGGGSIAFVDLAGGLKVGPHSAGADPGPAAYGLGGQDPTVTDAHVVVGTLGEGTPLAGRLALDVARAREAVSKIGGDLGLDTDEAARGIIAVTTAHTVRALRRVSVERGVDPREYTLVAFGGAGPMHAGQLLRELNLASVVVPTHPGLFSATGLVRADLRVDESQTVLQTFEPGILDELAAWYLAAAERLLELLRSDGVPRTRVRMIGSADCRYLGQGYELNVPLGSLGRRGVAAIARAFHALHATTYGHAGPEEPVELVTLRLSAVGVRKRSDPARIAAGRASPDREALVGHRPVLVPGTRRRASVPVYRRELLRAGNRLEGPAIVEEMDATTLILTAQRGEVDPVGNLWLREARGR